MAHTQGSSKIAVVTGDVTMDWNLAISRGPRGGASARTWLTGDRTRACWQRGGAALLADVLDATADALRQEGQADWCIRQTGAPREPVHPGDDRFHHSYATWSLFKYGERPPYDREQPAWRVEQFLGLDRSPASGATGAADWQRVVDDAPEASLLVLDDSSLGFRDQSGLWPQALTAPGSHPWILLKMARPVARGALWEHLLRNCGERLVVVTTVNDLRLTEVQISRELSWERTAQDLAWELVHNPRVNGLSRCAHVVISFNAAGAFLLSPLPPAEETARARRTHQSLLFFDPRVIEGTWEQEHQGAMIGYTTCLAARIARELMLAPDCPDIPRGILAGLGAMRRLHLEGYGERGRGAAPAGLAFPRRLIAGDVGKDAASFAVVEVQDPLRFLYQPAGERERLPETGFWTILQDRYPGNLDQVARQIALEGPEVALHGVPLGQFGALLTVDRREIESLRSIRALVGEYCRQDQPRRPLSIAVYGAPGSGKSFGITQAASSLLPAQIEVLEFNLSQFNAPADLADALHRVRDVSLGGKVPLVFWDEFDAPLEGKRLGWLRYFLSPMQDGSFREGQVVHPIGRSIFVFAGGTSHSMEEFGQGLGPDEFRAAKGPDFVSRLKGFVNVLGPNRQQGAAGAGSAPDPHYIIRRAILLRAILKRSAPHIFHRQDGKEVLSIDQGVLRAFLETRAYKHGVRSMDAIVGMSLLAGRAAFERSSLPAEAQLGLHVDGREFLALVQRMDLEGEPLERLAEAAHEVFCQGLRARGYRLGPQTDEKLKTHSLLKPYGELPEEEKESNRASVRDIASKLALVGYVMVPARSDEPPFGFPGDDLERLAEMEHVRWMSAKIASGWRCAPETDKDKKLHRSILPWRTMSEEERARLLSPAEAAAMGTAELPEEEKEKDRDLVRGIPGILRTAGYAIVKLRGGAVEE